MIYVKGNQVSAEEIADIWLESHPGIIENYSNDVQQWFFDWLKKNQVEYQYKGKRLLHSEFVEQLRTERIQQLMDDYRKKHPTVRKKDLKALDKNSSLMSDLQNIIDSDAIYQSLCKEDYQTSSFYQTKLQNYVKKKRKKILSRILKKVNLKMTERTAEVAKKYLEDIHLEDIVKKLDWYQTIQLRIEEHLSKQKIYFEEELEDPIDCEFLLNFASNYIGYLDMEGLSFFIDGEEYIEEYLINQLENTHEELVNFQKRFPVFEVVLYEKLIELQISEHLWTQLKEYFTQEKIMECILNNPFYQKTVTQLLHYKSHEQNIIEGLLTRIPENYKDLYPLARTLKRHFVLHIGPTNSGKTHEALEAFRAAEKALYLAPLRLLAYEVYEQSNALQCPCNMITGEEEIIFENATHTACTVEMANLQEHYNLAVIDEAQMLADRDRGSAWTNAILRVQADVVHVCAAEHAVDLLVKLINMCDDTYQIIEHNRVVPLEVSYESFSFPSSVKKHDALIVFSKAHVHSVAAELQKNGWNVSIIYGSLPYESRSREVERFYSGESDVVVSTDAIGMGMNLPIQRIVFLEIEKFDGVGRRMLNPEEVKQIAGRAGRKGIYNVGYCLSVYENNRIDELLHMKLEPLQTAYIDFSESLLSIEGKLSELLRQWSRLSRNDFLLQEDTRKQILLAEELEKFTNNKKIIFTFVKMLNNEENPELKLLWKKLFFYTIKNQTLSFPLDLYLPRKVLKNFSLEQLEIEYKKCDLCYRYCTKLQKTEARDQIVSYKKEIAKYISNYLEKQQLPIKKCKYCSIALPWNFPFSMCNQCYSQYYGWRQLEDELW